MNGDAPEITALAVVLNSISNKNLFAYCSNNPTRDKDILGYMSAMELASQFYPPSIFETYMAKLLSRFSKGLASISAYVTKLATKIAAKFFWWKPWMIVIIVVAAVGIVVAAISILYAMRKKEIDVARKKIPNKLINKSGKVDLNKFKTKLPNGQGYKGPDKWKIVRDTAGHATKKWKLYKNKERIASLLEDGTIYGK